MYLHRLLIEQIVSLVSVSFTFYKYQINAASTMFIARGTDQVTV